jgi:hypothetical protein
MTVALRSLSPQIPNPVSNFTSTITSLLALLELATEDDYGVLRPTHETFKKTLTLLLIAYEYLGERFPQGIASSDDQGGIRINWRNRQKDRRICLFLPANPHEIAYIYHQSHQDYASEQEVSGATLASWLDWFEQA